MCSPTPPPAPDYTGAAQAQGEANVETAVAQGKINNPNVYGPYGKQEVLWGGENNAIPAIFQTFSPEQQALYFNQTTAKQKLGELGIQGADALKGVVGTPYNMSGAPPAPGSATETRQKVYDAMMSRVNEDANRRHDNTNSSLIASGIRPGTKAYDDAVALNERIRTDAGTQAYLASGQEASRDFALDTEARRNAIAEQLMSRQTPLNEVTALLSGSQVANPFAMPGYAQNTAIQPAPLYNATNALGNYNADLYNAQAAGAGATRSGLFGLGGAALMASAMSDRRLKSNIVRIGTHPLGIGIYEYDLFGRREIGVMADELEVVKPEAVTVINGFQHVYYDLIGGRPHAAE